MVKKSEWYKSTEKIIAIVFFAINVETIALSQAESGSDCRMRDQQFTISWVVVANCRAS